MEIVVEPEVAGTIQNGAAVFFGQTRIDTAIEETTVQASAVTDEPDDPDGPGDTADPGTTPVKILEPILAIMVMLMTSTTRMM